MSRFPDFLRPLVVSGPSGVGKGFLIKRLFAEFPDKFGLSVSHTTRGPRPDEISGRDYHFTSPTAFRTLLQAGAFIEYAEFSDNMYGTSRQAVRDVAYTGRRCILEIEAQGIRQVKQTDMNPVFLFLSPPSMGALRKRLQDRGTESDAVIQRRLATSLREIEYAREPGAHDIVLVLDDYEKSYHEFRRVASGERIVGDVLPALDD
ncbi:hypothetical protein HWV62_20029 [Athelia sp. TMB]|nr:hypothetical protein HWV62_20029 [Athelia sp. TMB]